MNALFDIQKSKAATLIQSVGRGHLTREAVNLELLKHKSALIIQDYWKQHKNHLDSMLFLIIFIICRAALFLIDLKFSRISTTFPAM